MDEKKTLGYKIGQGFVLLMAVCLGALLVASTIRVLQWILVG